MTKSEFFKFAHLIAKGRNLAFYNGEYSAAFGAVLRELYAKGYQNGGRAFEVIEPWYKRRTWSQQAGQWVTL